MGIKNKGSVTIYATVVIGYRSVQLPHHLSGLSTQAEADEV